MPNSSVSPIPFEKKFHIHNPRPSSPLPPPVTSSKIFPFICQKTAPRTRPTCTTPNDYPESRLTRPQRFPAAGAAPYVPIRHCRNLYQGVAPPVTVRSMVPVFSAPPLPRASMRPSQVVSPSPVRIAPPVCIRQAVPVFAAPPVRKEEPPPAVVAPLPPSLPDQVNETGNKSGDTQGPEAVKLAFGTAQDMMVVGKDLHLRMNPIYMVLNGFSFVVPSLSLEICS